MDIKSVNSCGTKPPGKYPLYGYNGLLWFIDGDATVVIREDFVDLQESPAIFLHCPSCDSGDIIPPAERYRRFTCGKCGKDYSPDLSVLNL